MYANLHNLCRENPHSEFSRAAITSNRHFLSPNNTIYNDVIYAEPRQNFLPEYWGPDAWRFLETVASGYSKNPTWWERTQMRRFLETLRMTLPCEKCRSNFCGEIDELEDSDLQSPESVQSWLSKVREKIRRNKVKRKQQQQNVQEKFEMSCCGQHV